MEGPHPVFRSFVPDLVVAHNDAMAAGVRRVLLEIATRRASPPLARIPMVGCDGTSLGLRLIQDGGLTATVVVPGTAAPAVELVAEHLREGRVADPRVRLQVSVYPPLTALRPVQLV
jgi:ABC-type sugar transport system substrate-binding protein